MERGPAVVISQCCHHKQGEGKRDRLRGEETEKSGGKEREINIDSWESPLFLNYPCFLALTCVFEQERVSCLAPLNRAQMPGGYRDIT